jgi:phenylpyruvate tautomerase PptA (4-oxalocrotonate tautomerase family)
MPLVSLTTNSPDIETRKAALLERLSRTVADMLGKPERFVMVKVEYNRDMRFAGSDAPLAYVELKSIGLPADGTKAFSADLCQLIADEIGVFPDRIYIEFTDAPRHFWGWNSSTF